MASLLAGARLVLRQGFRCIPAYTVQLRAVPVRCLGSSGRFLTVATQEKGTPICESLFPDRTLELNVDSSFNQIRSVVKNSRHVCKETLLKSFNEICDIEKPSGSQAWFLLQSCGSLLVEVPLQERTEIAKNIWNKLQELGVVFDVTHYNALLKAYIENEHKFSPNEFLSDMEAANVEPDQSTHQWLIAAYCNEGDIAGASKILGFMKSKSLPITDEVFNYLITGHARSGDMDSAKNILTVMQDSGLTPGRESYVALLSAYAEKGDIESIKQTLDSGEKNLTIKNMMQILLSLRKAGHSEYVSDILNRMYHGRGYFEEVTRICLLLMNRGFEDTALQILKTLNIEKPPITDYGKQPGSFFIRQCVLLNMPAIKLKTFVDEIRASNLHSAPFEHALFCAVKNGKEELAYDLMKVMKEEGLPIRPHYFWPFFANYHKEKNLQGLVQVLHNMQVLDVTVEQETCNLYFRELFEDEETAQTIVHDDKLLKILNLYHSMIRQQLMYGYLKNVHSLLSKSKIPLVRSRRLISVLQASFGRSNDVETMAMITQLLCKDDHDRMQSAKFVGSFLYGLIDGMSDSDVQAKETHLRQYFHQLKEMDLPMDLQNYNRIKDLLESYKVPQLIEHLSYVTSKAYSVADVSALEEALDTLKLNNRPVEDALTKLLTALVGAQDLPNALKVKSKYEEDFNFGMYMKLLGLCCSTNNPEEALKLRQELQQKGFTGVPTVVKYFDLLSVLTENGLIEDAVDVLKEMKERDVPLGDLSAKHFFRILNDLALKGDVEAVTRLQKEILTLELDKPTTRLLSPLVIAHIKRNDLSAAMDAMIACNETYHCYPCKHNLLCSLVENGETDLLKKAVDHLHLRTGERLMLHDLLFAFIQTGKYAEARKISKTPGLRAEPNKMDWFVDRCVRTKKVTVLENTLDITKDLLECDRDRQYYSLFKLYDEINSWEKIQSAWQSMKEENIVVQEKTLKLLQSIFRKNGQEFPLQSLQVALEEEQSSDMEENEATQIPKTSKNTFAHFIMTALKNNDAQGAYKIFQDAEESNVQFSAKVYTDLIEKLLQNHQLEEALQVESLAKNHIDSYKMNTFTGSLLMDEQVRRNCLKDALTTLQKMLKDDKPPKVYAVCSLLEAFAMKGDVEIIEWIEEITADAQLRFYENYFDTLKFLAHLSNGNFEAVIPVIESTYIDKSKKTFSMARLFRNLFEKNMEDALEKLRIMSERLANQFGVYHPITELFLNYFKSGRQDEASELLERFNAIPQQRRILTRHIITESKTDKHDKLFRLLEVLPDYKETAYGYLMMQYEITNNVCAAHALYEKMKAEQLSPDDLFLKRLAILLRDAGKPIPFTEPPLSKESYRQLLHPRKPLEDENPEQSHV